MEKERIRSLEGLILFMLGSAALFSIMVLGSTRPSVFGYSGPYYLLAALVPVAVIGTGFVLMIWALVRSRKKPDLYLVNDSMAVVGFLFIAFGASLYFWSSSTPLGCPPNGICWASIFIPVLGIVFLDAGAFLMSFAISSRKKIAPML